MKYQAKFYLKDSKSEQETPINVHFWCNWKRFKVATGLKVHPKHWDSVKYRAKRGATFHAIINDRLEELELLMANLYEELRRSGREITPAALKELFDRATKRSSTEKETLLLLDRYRKFIDDSHDRLQPGTIKAHTTSLHHLQSFEAMTGMRYSYENVTMQFFNALVSYLVGKARLSNDSAWRVIKDFRAFLQHSIEQGHTANAEFKGFTKKRMPQGDCGMAILRFSAKYISRKTVSALSPKRIVSRYRFPCCRRFESSGRSTTVSCLLLLIRNRTSI
jgi:hypothetical protein